MKLSFDEKYITEKSTLLSTLTSSGIQNEQERNVVKFDLLISVAANTKGWQKDGAICFAKKDQPVAFKSAIKKFVLEPAGITASALSSQLYISHPWLSDVWPSYDETAKSFNATTIMNDLSIAFPSLVKYAEKVGKSIMEQDETERAGILAGIGVDGTCDLKSEIAVRESIFRKTAFALKAFTYDNAAWEIVDGTPASLLKAEGQSLLKTDDGKDRARTTVLRDLAKVMGSTEKVEFGKDGLSAIVPKTVNPLEDSERIPDADIPKVREKLEKRFDELQSECTLIRKALESFEKREANKVDDAAADALAQATGMSKEAAKKLIADQKKLNGGTK